MDHRFDERAGTPYTVGIEEELMILHGEILDLSNSIEAILGEDPPKGHVKPELLEPVLEISTSPRTGVSSAAAELQALRRLTARRAAAAGLRIGASGTHPFARWEELHELMGEIVERTAPLES
jgi:glutamate---cysteine ligase / carboxylate-amine ligase